MSSAAPVLTLTSVTKSYGGPSPVHALVDVNLTIAARDMAALVGPSGCGKSTLLHLCGGMDRPSAGRVVLESAALADLSDDELTRVRRTRIGFVFQFFNLLSTLTVQDNVELPLLLARRRPSDATAAAAELIARVGMSSRARHFPAQLSGGEMQRTAVARALVHRPALLIADEPTGNLDSDNGRAVLDLLLELNRDLGVTMLLATHAAEIAAAAGRVIRMADGRIVRDSAADSVSAAHAAV